MARAAVWWCLALLVPLAWIPVASAAPSVSQTVTIEVLPDLTERITIVVHGNDAFPSGIHLPEGAIVLGMKNFATPIPYDVTPTESGGMFVAPRGRSFDYTVEATFAPARPELLPLVSGRHYVGAFAGVSNDIRVDLRIPEGSFLFFAEPAPPDATHRSVSLRARDAVDLRYAYRAPLDPARDVEIEEGIFRLLGPPGKENEMRIIARVASEGAREAAAYAGIPVLAPYWVKFAPAGAFTWEAGYYDGEGIIAVGVDALAATAAHGFPWQPAATLVHEAFHAMSLPRGSGGFDGRATWWVEGTAKFAEQFVVGDDGWRSCDPTCYEWRAQMSREGLDAFYAGGLSFDADWDNERIPELLRPRAYDYSGYLVGAFAAQHGRDAYRAAWTAFRAAAANASGCPCDRAALERMLSEASGKPLAGEDLYLPWRALYATDRAAFERTVAPLVDNGIEGERPTPRREPGAAAPSPGPWRPALAIDERVGVVRTATGVRLDVVARDVALLAEGVHLPLDDRPAAHVRAFLDDEEVQEGVSVAADRAQLALAAATGARRLRVEALAGETPLATFQTVLRVPPHYTLALEREGDDLVARASDGAGGPPLEGIDIRFEIDGAQAPVVATDAAGQARVAAPAAPGDHHARAIASLHGEELGVATLDFSLAPPTPRETPATPTRSEPSPEAPSATPRAPASPSAPVPLAPWIAALALALVLAGKRQKK